MAQARMRHCFNCGEELGVYSAAYYYKYESCGKIECQRAERDAELQEREEAHQQLDRDNGWS